MSGLQTRNRRKILLVLAVVLNLGALLIAALSFLQGDVSGGAFWLLVAGAWLVMIRIVLRAND